MAFPTSGLTNNQVHKEGNRAFVYDSALGVWDQVRETDRTENKIFSGEIGSGVTGYTGPKVAEMWRVASGFTGSEDPIVDWEASGTGTDGSHGAANFSSTMTVDASTGVFTFPQTGYYLIQFNFAGYSSSSTDSRYNQANIDGSVNAAAGSPTYVGLALGNMFVHGIAHGVHFSSSCQAIMDVTAVADVKVRFSVNMAGSVNADTSGDKNNLHVLFLRLGDT